MGSSGKGGQTAAPESGGDDAITMMFMQKMQEQMANAQMMQMSAMSAPPSVPDSPQMPDIYTPDDIDWTDKQDALKNKIKADYGSDAGNRKNRSDTVLTSPLLDPDDTNVLAGSILGGE